MHHFNEQGGEAKAVGWISMADMFMLCSIVMLAVAVGFAMSLKKTDVLLTTNQDEFAKYRSANTLTIDELKSTLTQVRSEAGDYRTQIASLNQQLSNLKAQLLASEQQSAKFKAQGEGLANELSIQTAKLSSVQSEFEKYRNINSLSLAELKSELVRALKSLDESKASVASLQLQESTLRGKLAESEKLAAALKGERDKYKSDSERLTLDLQNQKSQFETELGKLNAALTRATGDLAKANADKEQLLIDLNASKLGFAALQKENDDQKMRLVISDSEKKKLEGKLATLEGTIAGLTGEIGVLKPQIAKLEVDLTGARLRIIDLEKDVFETINRAKLAITVTAQDVPKDFTLELFVTDPLGNECGPFSSVIFNEGDEIGVLQQSVDFRSGKAGAQKAVFYSLRPIVSRSTSGGTYSVRAMIRHNGNNENVRLPASVAVTCNIDLPFVPGPDAHKIAKRDITSAGFIKKVRRNGQLTASTPYKNMWPWEPVYHFDRFVCDFKIDGDKITDMRTYEELPVAPPGTASVPFSQGAPEQRIDSIRNRSGN